MTNPNPRAIGEVTVDVNASGEKVPGQVHQITDDMGKQLDRDLKKQNQQFDDLGRALAQTLRESIRKEFREHGVIGDALDEFLEAAGDAQVQFQIDREVLDRESERAGRDTRDGFFRGLFGGGRGGEGFLSILTGPTGAFFNIPSRSPLALILLPLLGAIIAFITAAIHGLQALTSLLYLIPSLLFAIGLQGLSLFLIFSGLGEAVGAAFAATNAAELNEALKNIEVNAANVIRELLPWRDFFKELKTVAQQQFFSQISGDLTRVLDNVRKPLTSVISDVSEGLGVVASSILDVFASEQFADTLSTIGASTRDWLLGFGPALGNFLDGVNQFAIAIDPFLDWFGEKFNEWVFNLGEWFKGLGTDPEFMQWIEDVKPILGDFKDFLRTVWEGLKEFIQAFIEADKQIKAETGRSFLEWMTDLLQGFIDLISTELGVSAMKGFIYTLLAVTALFYAIATAVLLVVAALELLFDTIEKGSQYGFFGILGAIFGGGGGAAQQPTGHLFGQGASDADKLATAADNVTTSMGNANVAISNVDTILGEIGISANTEAVPGIQNVNTEIDNLYANAANGNQAGKNVTKSMADGIIQGTALFLSPALYYASKFIYDHFPHSPAKLGPLAGTGDPLLAGRNIMSRVAMGMELGASSLSTAANNALGVTFGTGSVNVNYYGGTPPTSAQAQAMGSAAGRGIIDQMTATRLAVRTM